MASYSIIKLKNLSPLHIGTGKENYDFAANKLHSDTISSALASMRVLQGKKDDIDKFLDSFAISSAFLFVGEKYFMPRPMENLNIDVLNHENHLVRKQLKKIQYIELSIWNKLVSGDKISIKDYQLQNEFLVDSEDFLSPNRQIVTQRVMVPRNIEDSEPFFFNWNFFKKDAGLYFITDASGEILNEITSLFSLLGEQGIGTDKNIGGGKFEIETDTITISDVQEANAKMLLSLYIPSEEELASIDLASSKYELLQRGGYIAGSEHFDFWHLRKKSIYMFNVGSILQSNAKLSGKIVDLKPTNYNDERMHPVYRSGKPLALPIKLTTL